MSIKDSSSSSSAKGSSSMARKNKLAYMTTFNSLIVFGLLATGTVPWGDSLFAVFASSYVYIFLIFVFPPSPAATLPRGASRYPGGKYFTAYVTGAAIIGILIPLVHVIISFVRGDWSSVGETSPHLFLLAAQVLSENLTAGVTEIPIPIRALVPVLYNARRLITLDAWATAVFSKGLSSGTDWVSNGYTLGQLFWRFNVVANVLFWHYNLWAFLLPHYLPWVFKTHFTAVIKHAN